MCQRRYSLLSIFIIVVIVSASSWSCKKNSGQSGSLPSSDSVTVDSASKVITLTTDEEKLLIFQKLSTGITYEQLKAQMPGISELVTEGAGARGMEKYGLYEAFYDTPIFSLNSKIEFNFKNNKLYGYYYLLRNLDSAAAWSLYDSLTNFYSRIYGTYEESFENDPAGVAYSRRWETGKGTFGVALSIYSGAHTLGWGI